jgi:hypothetical protein
MVWSVVAHLAALLLDLVMARRQSEGAKDREIAVLRYQLRLLEHRQPRPCLSLWGRLTLALLATKLRHLTSDAYQRLSRCLVLVEPGTVLRWHRDLARRKWTCRRGVLLGRAVMW